MAIQVPNMSGNYTRKAVVAVKSKLVEVEWTKEQLRSKFISEDMDGDGKLSKNEIKKVFKDLGSSSGFYRAKKALWRADADDNGYININDHEFEDLLQYAYDCGYKIKP
ncbi:hypothetical protein CsatA_016468 [Cannabis sativa]